MLYRRLWFVLLLGGLFSPLKGLAWSAQGHAAIAEAAFAQLGTEQQRYFDLQAKALITNERAKKWRKSLTHYSAFSQAAVWPDTRRDMALNTVFSRFAKTAIPPALAHFASANTKQWHYVNAQYWDTTRQQLLPASSVLGRCKVKRTGQLDAVLPALIEAYHQLKTPAAQGVVLAFIGHLMADAYQPLHTLAGLDAQCYSDAGGNGYCLSTGKRRCALNLHRLWDAGFEVFQQPIKSGPLSGDLLKLNDFNAVFSASAQEAAFIYSTPRLQPPNKAYTRQAAAIVARQSAAAAQALAALLHTIYTQKQRANNE